MPETEYKAFAECKALESDAGGFEGYASLFGVRDAIGDVFKPGAFSRALKRFVGEGWIALNHDWQALPIGTIAEAHEDDKGLFVRGAYHSTPEAQAARRVAAERHERGKPMGLSVAFTLAEGGAERTSWGRNLTSVDQLHEVSHVNMPMLRPARISGVKSAVQQLELELRGAVGRHRTGTATGAWDGPANEARLSNDDGARVYRGAYAWQDPDKDPDTKAAWRFIHHFVGSDGSVGDASTIGCSTGIGVLNGGRQGTTIPDADRRGVWSHLAGHLRDADMTPPELRGMLVADMLARGLDFAEVVDELKAAGDLAHGRALHELVGPALAELDTWLHADEKHATDVARRRRFESERRLFRVASLNGRG